MKLYASSVVMYSIVLMRLKSKCEYVSYVSYKKCVAFRAPPPSPSQVNTKKESAIETALVPKYSILSL